MTYANLFRIPAALLLACVGLIAADDIGLGTWKLDNGKSTTNGKPVEGSSTVTFTQSGDEITRVFESVGPDGKTTTTRWTGKLDGKDYPTSEAGVTASLKRTGKDTIEGTLKVNGNVVQTSTRTLSPDGKVVHVTLKGTDRNGQSFTSELYFDKQ